MREPFEDIPFGRVTDDVRQYVCMKIASAKLHLVESLSRLFGNAMRLLFFVLFCSMALMAFGVALIMWLTPLVGSVALAALLVGLLCLIIGFILLAAKKMFINPMVGMFSGMVFRKRKIRNDED